MPYEHISELPEHVRQGLPEEAQELYLTAYVHAWNEHEDPSTWREGHTREDMADLLAWAAVKKQYEKIGTSDQWRHK
jgi:cation transport regulator